MAEHREEPGLRPGARRTRTTGLRVLLVEDEPSAAEALAYLLRADGFVVDWVGTGPEALASLARALPDIVLLDRLIPDADGLDICRDLRRRSSVPIIMITALDSREDVVQAREAGADAYVAKPYQTVELWSLIHALAGRDRPAA